LTECINCRFYAPAVRFIRNLDDFEELPVLNLLDFINTAVRKLAQVSNRALTKLICYNVKVTPKRVAAFKSNNPDRRVVYLGKPTLYLT
ncbi:MAG: hypothetical protein U5K54_00220, partial [Cytophagales bacterium]|nr:hypothetical protein [Cytophagales bacterium]